MARGRFNNLIADAPAAAAPKRPKAVEAPQPAMQVNGNEQESRAPSRQGKRALGGHFSPELVRTMNVMAKTEDTTVQALLGEAIDLLMRARGKHPFGEGREIKGA